MTAAESWAEPQAASWRSAPTKSGMRERCTVSTKTTELAVPLALVPRMTGLGAVTRTVFRPDWPGRVPVAPTAAA